MKKLFLTLSILTILSIVIYSCNKNEDISNLNNNKIENSIKKYYSIPNYTVTEKYYFNDDKGNKLIIEKIDVGDSNINGYFIHNVNNNNKVAFIDINKKNKSIFINDFTKNKTFKVSFKNQVYLSANNFDLIQTIKNNISSKKMFGWSCGDCNDIGTRTCCYIFFWIHTNHCRIEGCGGIE